MAVVTDLGSAAMPIEKPYNANGTRNGTWRGIGSSWFNRDNIAAEDFMRQQQLQNREMNFNAQEAQKNRDWQEMMSNTSYQRAVEDMKAAGINPLLAMSNGGASSPGGSAASIGSASLSSSGPGDDLSAIVGGLLRIAGEFVDDKKPVLGAVFKSAGKVISRSGSSGSAVSGRD